MKPAMTALVIDHDDLGEDGVRDVIEETRYANHWHAPKVMRVESREVDWTDGHPLNYRDRQRDAFDDLFRGVGV